MYKYIKRGIALLTAAAVAGGGIFAYSYIKAKKAAPDGGMEAEGLTALAEMGSIVNTVTATGTVMLNNEIEVYAEGETNKIKEFNVEEGDSVAIGELLVTYDTDDQVEELKNKIRDTKRDIENAQLSLKSMQLPTSDSELQKLQNEVESSEKSLTEAQNNVQTIQTNIKQQNTEIANALKDWQDAQKTVSDNEALLKVGGVAQEEYDNSVTLCERAEQSYNNALDSLDSLNISLENAERNVKSAENSLSLANTSLDEAINKLDLEENKIKLSQQQLTLRGLQDTLSDAEKDLAEIVYSTYSTVNGVVTQVCVDEGTYTEENTVMLKVADLNDLIVSANIEEYDAPLLELGQKVVMTSDGLENRTYTGEITKINITAESASSNMGTETVVPVEISVDNPDGVLKQNYSLDLEIYTLNKENIICVPTTAISTDSRSGEAFVYKVENDALKRTPVEIGDSDDTNTEITSGLNSGESILTSPTGRIRDGMTLEELAQMSAPADSGGSEQNQGQGLDRAKEGGTGDRDRQFGQDIQSRGFGGNGAGGGMPPGGGR